MDDDFNFFLPDTLLEDSDSDGEGGGARGPADGWAKSKLAQNFAPAPAAAASTLDGLDADFRTSRLLSNLMMNSQQDGGNQTGSSPTFATSGALPRAPGSFDGDGQYNMYTNDDSQSVTSTAAAHTAGGLGAVSTRPASAAAVSTPSWRPALPQAGRSDGKGYQSVNQRGGTSLSTPSFQRPTASATSSLASTGSGGLPVGGTKRMTPAASASSFSPTNQSARMTPANRVQHGGSVASRSGDRNASGTDSWNSQNNWQLQTGKGGSAQGKIRKDTSGQKASPLGNLEAAWMGSTAQQQQGVNPNADEFKRVGGNKVHVNKPSNMLSQKAKEAERVKRERDEQRLLAEKEREKDKKKQQEQLQKTQARIAAARGEVSEPVFPATKVASSKSEPTSTSNSSGKDAPSRRAAEKKQREELRRQQEQERQAERDRAAAEERKERENVAVAAAAAETSSSATAATAVSRSSSGRDDAKADGEEPSLSASSTDATHRTKKETTTNSKSIHTDNRSDTSSVQERVLGASEIPGVGHSTTAHKQQKSPDKDKASTKAPRKEIGGARGARDTRSGSNSSRKDSQQNDKIKRASQSTKSLGATPAAATAPITAGESSTDASSSTGENAAGAAVSSLLSLLPFFTTKLSNGMHWVWSSSAVGSKMFVDLVAVLLRFVLKLHKSALTGLTADHHVAFCFTFLYSFPYLVAYITPWAPPWAPVCLWYAFLVQLFCIQGQPKMVMVSRRVLPVMFMLEGVSHHSFLLDLNGSERLVFAFLLSALKTRSLQQTVCLMSMIAQVLLTCLLGCSTPFVQWIILIVGLSTITPDNGLSSLAGHDDFGHDDHVLSGHGSAISGAHLASGIGGDGLSRGGAQLGGSSGGGGVGGTIIFQSSGMNGSPGDIMSQVHESTSAAATNENSAAIGLSYGLSGPSLSGGAAMRARVVPGRRAVVPGAIPRNRRVKSGSRP